MTKSDEFKKKMDDETKAAERYLMIDDRRAAYMHYCEASQDAEELSFLVLDKDESDAYMKEGQEFQKKAEEVIAPLSLSPEEKAKITPRKKVKGFDEFVGLGKLKDYLREDVVTPWKNHTLNQRKKHGLFFYGPEGVAKNAFVRALIHELNATGCFIEPMKDFNIYNSSNYKYHVKVLFQKIEEKNNVVVVFPKPVAFFPKDDSKISRTIRKYFLKVLKKEQKKVRKKNLNVLFVATSTAPDKMSMEAFGPNGFDDLIRIHHPNKETRLEMIQERLKDIPFVSKDALDKIATSSHHYTTKEVSRLCRSVRKVEEVYSQKLPKGELAPYTDEMLDRVLKDFVPVDDPDYDRCVPEFENELPKGMEIIEQ